MKHTNSLLSVKQMPPAYQIVQAPERKRPTLLGVLWHKFLLWLQDASWHRVRRALCRLLCVAGIVTGFAAPQLLLDALAASLRFHDALLPKAGAVIVVLFYGRVWYRYARRLRFRMRAGANQHTFEGVPVDELAGYLLTSGRFTREDSMSRLGLSQPRHKKIADLLEQSGVLYRGECNALQLRDISREQLVLQLRGIAQKKSPPLVYDPVRNDWHERDGAAARWFIDRERKERREMEDLERAKKRVARKEERLTEQLESLAHSPFVTRLISADAAV